MASTDEALPPVLYEGQLGKLGGFFWKEFQQRYCVVRGHTIAYYGTKEDFTGNNVAPRGTIDIRCTDIILHDDASRYPSTNEYPGDNRFTLRGPLLKHDYIFDCPDKATRDAWVDFIKNVEIQDTTAFSVLGFGKPPESFTQFMQDSAALARVQAQYMAVQGLVPNPQLARRTQKAEPMSESDIKKICDAAVAIGPLNSVNGSGVSVMHLITSEPWCSEELCEAMFARGATIHGRDFYGNTILTEAVVCRDAKFIEYLLSKKVNPLAKSKYGYTALHILCKEQRQKHFTEVLPVLLKASKAAAEARSAITGKPADEYRAINAIAGPSHCRGPPLYLAAANRSIDDDHLKTLVDIGADLMYERKSDTSADGEVESIFTERAGSKWVLTQCMAKGKKVNRKWFEILTMYSAIARDDAKILELINQIETTVRVSGGNTAAIAEDVDFDTLGEALCSREKRDVFDKLIQLGANPKQRAREPYAPKGKEPQGATLMHEAVKTGKIELIEALLQLGVALDVAHKDSSASSRSRADEEDAASLIYPIDEVWYQSNKKANTWDIVKFLLEKGSPATSGTLRSAICQTGHDVEVFKMLSQRVLETAKKDRLCDVDPDLIWTVVVNIGVERGSQKYPGKSTAVDIVEDLCAKGMKVAGGDEFVDSCGDSPMHGMIIRSSRIKSNNVAGIFQLLIAAGANPEVKDKKGKTVLEFAQAKLGDAVAKILKGEKEETNAAAAAPQQQPKEEEEATPAPAAATEAPAAEQSQGGAAATDETAPAAAVEEEEKKMPPAEPAPEGSSAITLFFKTISNKTITVTTATNATVDDVKKQIEAQEGMPADAQLFSWAGKQLENGRALMDYNVSNEATIRLMLRLRKMQEEPSGVFEPDADGNLKPSSLEECD